MPKPMKTKLQSFLFGAFVAGIFLAPVHAQTAASTPAQSNSPAPTAVPAGQAPDDATRKIAELVHAGKYADAQQLTTGLLVAYPDDQRLIKAKAMLEQLLAAPGSATPVPNTNQPSNNAVAAQPPPPSNADQLTGMDKVDYNALIELARQAQQTTDLAQQKASLRQFMSESNVFLRKHPDELLIWQIRAASAIGLDDPDAGYEAGQKLLAAGAADSNDPNLQQLLSNLKIKGWLDKQGVELSKQKIEEDKKYGWLLGNWKVSFSYFSKAAFDYGQKRGTNQVEFMKSGSGVEGYVTANGHRFPKPAYKYTVRNSDEITLPANWGVALKPPQWEPVSSISFASDKRTMTIIVKGTTYVLAKMDDAQNQ